MTPSPSLPIAAPSVAASSAAVSTVEARLDPKGGDTAGSFEECCERAVQTAMPAATLQTPPTQPLPQDAPPADAEALPVLQVSPQANEASAETGDEVGVVAFLPVDVAAVSPMHARAALPVDNPATNEPVAEGETVAHTAMEKNFVPSSLSQLPAIAPRRGKESAAQPAPAARPQSAIVASEVRDIQMPAASTIAAPVGGSATAAPALAPSSSVKTGAAVVPSTALAREPVVTPIAPTGEIETRAAAELTVPARNAAPAEKSAAAVVRGGSRPIVKEDSVFLNSDGERVAKQSTPAGTGVALPVTDMRSAPFLHQRLGLQTGLRSNPAAGADAEGEGLSVTWKGWTNGGGERASTAAQFSRLGEHSPAQHAPFFTAPGFGTNRAGATTTVTMPSKLAPAAFSINEAEATAPVSAAIERLIARGQDHLSVTVRFEQGGSLSLKLAMREGEIVSQFQTDVPGLENALRSAWGQFSHDWHGRGWKLAQPNFSSSASTQQDAGGSGRDARFADRGDPDSGAPFASASAGRSPRRAGQSASLHASAAPATTTHRNATGLTTWA